MYDHEHFPPLVVLSIRSLLTPGLAQSRSSSATVRVRQDSCRLQHPSGAGIVTERRHGNQPFLSTLCDALPPRSLLCPFPFEQRLVPFRQDGFVPHERGHGRSDVVGWTSENDALGNTLDRIPASVERRVEQVVRRLFERGQHEDRVFHLGDTEPSDAQNFSLHSSSACRSRSVFKARREYENRSHTERETDLETHDVSQQHQVTRIDPESVRVHRVVNLVDDTLSSRFDTEDAFDFHDVIRRGQVSDDTCRGRNSQ